MATLHSGSRQNRSGAPTSTTCSLPPQCSSVETPSTKYDYSVEHWGWHSYTCVRVNRISTHQTLAWYWAQMQRQLFSALRSDAVTVCADGRCDSPGLSAQYCLYSFAHADHSRTRSDFNELCLDCWLVSSLKFYQKLGMLYLCIVEVRCRFITCIVSMYESGGLYKDATLRSFEPGSLTCAHTISHSFQ